MNEIDEHRGSADINILWPDPSHDSFIAALEVAEDGGTANNICPIIRYSLNNGGSAIWFGDLETDFLTGIEDAVTITSRRSSSPRTMDASRASYPRLWLEALDPKIVVIGEAASEHLDYYRGFDTITQNSAGDIAFNLHEDKVDVHVSSDTYTADFLDEEGEDDLDGLLYIGSVTA